MLLVDQAYCPTLPKNRKIQKIQLLKKKSSYTGDLFGALDFWDCLDVLDVFVFLDFLDF